MRFGLREGRVRRQRALAPQLQCGVIVFDQPVGDGPAIAPTQLTDVRQVGHEQAECINVTDTLLGGVFTNLIRVTRPNLAAKHKVSRRRLGTGFFWMME